MYGYICMFKGKRIEIEASSKYEAQEKGAKLLKAKKSYDVITMLCEIAGKQVLHATSDV